MNRPTRHELISGIVWLIILGLIVACLVWSGCGPPPYPTHLTVVGPMVSDEPPELNRPLGPLDRIQQLQERCWELRFRWNHLEGWYLKTKEETGQTAQEITEYKAPTLDEVLRKAKP